MTVERAGDGDALRLPAGEPAPLHTELLCGVEVVGAGGIEGMADDGGLRIGAERNVVGDRAADQARGLPRPRQPVGRCEVAHVGVGEGRCACEGCRAAEGGDQARLAGAARALDQRDRARCGGERDRREVADLEVLYVEGGGFDSLRSLNPFRLAALAQRPVMVSRG